MGGVRFLTTLAARGISVADVSGYSVLPDRDVGGRVIAYAFSVTLRDGRVEAWREEVTDG